MVTTIRAITQELDAFASEFATQMEHRYVDNRPLAEELRAALQTLIPVAAAAAKEPVVAPVQPRSHAPVVPRPAVAV